MKTLLAVAWLVIITGSVFIAITFFKPKPTVEEPQNLTPVVEEETAETPETPEYEIIGIDQPQTYSEYLKLGDEYLNDKLINSAISNYKAATNIDNSIPDAYLRLAEAYLTNNQPNLAKTTFEQALTLDQNSTHIKVGIVRSLLNMRNPQEAKEKLATLDQNDFEVKYYQAILNILSKNFDQSRKIFEEIIDTGGQQNLNLVNKSKIFIDQYQTYEFFVESDVIHLQTLLAKALTEVKEFQAAIPLLFDVLNQQNNYRDAWTILGYAYLNTEQYQDAIDSFEQAIALAPNDPNILFFLGLSYEGTDDIQQAIFYIEKASQNGFAPQNEIDLKLGELYLRQGENLKAAQSYERVIKTDPKDINLFVRTVWLYIDKLHDPDKAMKIAETAKETHPGEAMSFNLLGWAANAQENYQDAKTYLKQALEIDPQLESAYYNFGLLYEEQGFEMLAKEYFKKAYQLGNGNDISNLAANHFNQLNSSEDPKFYQVNTLSL